MYGSFEIHKRNCLVGLAMVRFDPGRGRANIYYLTRSGRRAVCGQDEAKSHGQVGRCCLVMVAFGGGGIGDFSVENFLPNLQH